MALRGWWWIIVVGVVARGMLLVCDPPTGGLGRLEPSVIAENLNAGRGFTFEQYGATYRAWKEPLYIVLLAGITRWWGNATAVLVGFQTFFSLTTALAVAGIARYLLGDPTKAVLAGTLAVLNPFLVYYDTHWIHPLSLDAFLFLVTIGMTLWAVEAQARLGRSLWAGLAMGIVLWQRAALLAAGVAAWVAALVVAPRRLVVARQAAVWCAVAVLVIAPWVARNDALFNRPLITTDAAHILWLGNNPWSNGTYSDLTGQRVIVRADPELLARLDGASELEHYELFLAETQRFIREHPERFAALILQRLWAFVWFSPNAGVGYAAWQEIFYRMAYVILLGLGLLGFWWFWRRAGPAERRGALTVLAGVAGLAAVHGLTAINMKHRVPFELMLAVFAAEAIVRLATRGYRAGGTNP